MPTRSDSDTEGQAFLSPEEQFEVEGTARGADKDQGASPILRRSTRKRKSTASVTDMSKNSGSKKKKPSSPANSRAEDPCKSMPKIPRTPQSGASTPSAPAAAGGQTPSQGQTTDNVIEQLLHGMESRLITRMEATNQAVNEAVSQTRMTNDCLVNLEEKVDANEENLRKALEEAEFRMMGKLQETEVRMMGKLQDTVKDMVTEQLRAAGFDPDLTAGALPTPTPTPTPAKQFTYASAAASDLSEKTSTASRATKHRPVIPT